MIPAPARIWFVLAGVFALLGAGAWVAGQAVGGAGFGVVVASSAAFTVACLVLGILVAVVARTRR